MNYNNLMQGYGDVLPRHNLNVAGVFSLPYGFQLEHEFVYSKQGRR